jgi:hypothetical protein
LPVAHWVPGHGDVVDRAGLDEAIGANLAAIQQSRLHVLTAIKQAQTLPAVVATVQAALAMPSASIAQYAVFASGIAAYLQWLVADGAAVAELTDAGLVWRAL